MKSGRLGRFILILCTALVVGLVRDYVLRALTMTIANLIFEADSFASYLLSSSLAHLGAGILCVLPIFWNLRDNGSHKREFLAYFSQHPYNADGVSAFIKTIEGRRADLIVYALAVLAVLLLNYGMVLFSSVIVVIEVIIAFFFMMAVYLFFDYKVRRMVYKKWEENRLHR